MAQQQVARETWTNKLDFMLSCIGYAVGLGNVWRFPYLCYRNGGGAFLVPYAIMLLIAGLPIFFFELALGQFASEGPVTVWKVNPMFYGIGWGMVTISGMVSIYYNVIITYSIYYMFVSFVNLDGDVPWAGCDNSWNTKYCRGDPYPEFDSMTNNTQKIIEQNRMYESSCVEKLMTNITRANTTILSIYDLDYNTFAANFTECKMKLVSPSEEYWSRFVLRLHESDSMDNVAGISLKNVICLLFAWILIFFCLMKGIKSSGKVVYFTATFPYLILIVLLIRGVTLPGYEEGIKFYIIPKWDKLLNAKVWADAATQIFYSLGPGFGGLLCMASFNNFRNNCWRDSVIVAFINCGTSVFAGFAIFSLLGFMADQTNQAVEDVAADGPGLAFIAYPEGLARLPISSFWAFLFFFMLLTLGLDSQFVMMETVISGATDVWPHILRKRKALFTFFCCIVGFVLGIPMTTKGGIYVLTLFDWYSGSYNLMLVAFFELIAVCWFYGVRQFKRDIEMMFGVPSIIWFYYLPAWVIVTPVAILFIVIMSGVNYTAAYYNDYIFPSWAEGVGWVLAVLPIVMIIVGAIFQIIRSGGHFGRAIAPRPDWGPRLKVNRTGAYNDNYGYESDGDEEKPPINGQAEPPYSITKSEYPEFARL